MDHAPPVSIPRLRTPRLTLREYRLSDFPAFAAHLIEMGGYDRRDAWRAFGCNTGGWLLDGVGWWAVDSNDALEVRGDKRITALVAAANTASRKVAEHLGLRYERDVELWGKSLGKYERSV